MFLGNGIKLKSRVLSTFALTDISSLKAWYKNKGGVTVDGSGNISTWADSSGNTSENMDVSAPASDNITGFDASTGAAIFSAANKI